MKKALNLMIYKIIVNLNNVKDLKIVLFYNSFIYYQALMISELIAASYAPRILKLND